MTLIRIVAPHFCAGFEAGASDYQHPRRVPPILWYMRDWSLDRISAYCRRKGWTMEIVPMT